MKIIFVSRCLIYPLLVVLVVVISGAGAVCGKNPHQQAQITMRLGKNGEEQPEFTIEANKSSVVVAEQPANCEDALLALDHGVIKVREMEDTYLIIIARPRNREKSAGLSQDRLRIIERSYLKRFPDIRYVTAVGSRTKGLGQIEIYVGGKLLSTLRIEKDAKAFCSEPI